MMSVRLLTFGLSLLVLQSGCSTKTLKATLIDSGYIALPNTKTVLLDGSDQINVPQDAFVDGDGDLVLTEGLGNAGSGVAFAVYQSSPDLEMISGRIKFDRVVRNDGNGYDADTAIFRAPVSGTYSFTLAGPQHLLRDNHIELMVDGKLVLGGKADTVNIHVEKGVPVWVECDISGPIQNFESFSFYGHLLSTNQ